MPKDNSNLVNLVKGVKLKDAGVKRPKTEECCSPLSSTDKISYPSLYLNTKNAPDLKGYDTGDEVLLVIKGVITGHDMSKRKSYENETFDIEVKKIACINKK